MHFDNYFYEILTLFLETIWGMALVALSNPKPKTRFIHAFVIIYILSKKMLYAIVYVPYESDCPLIILSYNQICLRKWKSYVIWAKALVI